MKLLIALIRNGPPGLPDEPFQVSCTNIPLSSSGAAMLLSNVENGLYPQVSRVYTDASPECAETAACIYRLPALIVPDIAGYDYGGLERLPYRRAVGTEAFREWAASASAAGMGGGVRPYVTQTSCVMAFKKIADELAGTRLPSAAFITRKPAILTIVGRFLAPSFLYFYEDIPYGGGYLVEYDTIAAAMRIRKRIKPEA